MSSKAPTQFVLIEHKEPCRFCWLEKREFVERLSSVGNTNEREIALLISTWVRLNGVKVPLGLLYGIFTFVSNLFLFNNGLLFSLAIGVVTSFVVTLVRVLVLWASYRNDEKSQQAALIHISEHTHTEIALVAKWINDSLVELFLWRQFARGFSLVICSIYAAITLDFFISGVVGFLLWLTFGILRYPLWRWGHYKLDSIDFSRTGATRAELRPLWSDFFHLSYFVFTSATSRWAIAFICLFVVLFRLGGVTEPGQFVYGYAWYFYFIAANFLVSLRNDVV